jgi:hypothetical protein
MADALSDRHFDPEAIAFRAAMLANNTRILFPGAARRSDYNVPAA